MNRYQAAGVDVTAGYELVKKIKADVASTKRPGVRGGIGSFGGLFDLGSLNYHHPVLVAGTDGVGTKLMIAQAVGDHTTVGIDLVAMCANDVLAQGAEPLFFLDYIATGKNVPAKMAAIVSGVAAGCRQAGCALLGGETAEMPDMYAQDEYDLAGTLTGAAEKEQLLTADRPQVGDVLLGLASSGVHSNGFSLVRQIVQEAGMTYADRPAALAGASLGEALLTPTKIYVPAVLPLVQAGQVHGIAHITGGGLPENLPRMFGDALQAVVDPATWSRPAIFDWLLTAGNLSLADAFATFNMGLGLILAVAPDQVAAVQAALAAAGEPAVEVGRLQARPAGAAKLIIKGVTVNGTEEKEEEK